MSINLHLGVQNHILILRFLHGVNNIPNLDHNSLLAKSLAPRYLGASLITGDFGKGKTFGLGCDIYKQKHDYKDICIIANLPWAIVDHFYSSMEDFLKIIDYLYLFLQDTNNQDTLDGYESKYKDIIFVCDEAQ